MRANAYSFTQIIHLIANMENFIALSTGLTKLRCFETRQSDSFDVFKYYLN